jgi:sec-independent protein translocase protein TatB
VGSVGPEKLLLVFVIALIVLGPNKLPEAARTIGKLVGEFRRVSSGFQAEMRDAIFDPVNSVHDAFMGSIEGPAVTPPAAGGPMPAGASIPSVLPAPPDDPSLN